MEILWQREKLIKSYSQFASCTFYQRECWHSDFAHNWIVCTRVMMSQGRTREGNQRKLLRAGLSPSLIQLNLRKSSESLLNKAHSCIHRHKLPQSMRASSASLNLNWKYEIQLNMQFRNAKAINEFITFSAKGPAAYNKFSPAVARNKLWNIANVKQYLE